MDAPRIAALSRLFAANMRQRGYRKADPQRFVNGFRGERDGEAKPKGRLFGGADREDYD